MAKLDYQLSGGVMNAYGKAMAGKVDPALAKADKVGVAGSSIAKGLMDMEVQNRADKKESEAQEERDRIEKARETNEARKKDALYGTFQEKADLLLEGNVQGGTKNQKSYQETFVSSLETEYLKAVDSNDWKAQREIMNNLDELTKTTEGLSASTKAMAENGAKGNAAGFDNDVIPMETAEWMAFAVDVEQSGASMVRTGEEGKGPMGYRMPREGQEDLIITQKMMEDVNTKYLSAAPEAKVIQTQLNEVRTQSIKTLADKDNTTGNVGYNKDTHYQAIMDVVTKDRMRSVIFSKGMWGGTNDNRERESFFDTWKVQDMEVDIKIPTAKATDAAWAVAEGGEASELDQAMSDGVLTKDEMKSLTLTDGDKKAVAELLCLPENFEKARGVIGGYVDGLILQNTDKAVTFDANDY